MKINLTLKFRIILIFFIIYIASLVIVDIFIIKNLNLEKKFFNNLELDKKLSSLALDSKNDKMVKKLLSEYLQYLAKSKYHYIKMSVYSSLLLFFISLFSIFLFFVLIIYITKPLDELKKATSLISKGNFDIRLKENGYPEIINLKHSFNIMSEKLNEYQKKLLEEEKNKIWKEFSRILAHEIKNPLTPIQLSLERLETHFYESNFEKFKKIFPESLKIIKQEVKNLNLISQSFSEFAKTYHPIFKEINLCNFIKSIIAPYKSNIKIELLCDNDISINFDEKHLYQIITNILQNAIDFSQNKKIIIKIYQENKYVNISIADFGMGISDVDKIKIFEPYFSKKKKGMGLGLSIVKKLIDLNNANIKVLDNKPTGTIFQISKRIEDK